MRRPTGLILEPRRPQTLRLGWAGGIPPASPADVDHLTGWSFELGGNDARPTCAPTSVSNHRKMTSRFLSGSIEDPTDADVWDVFARAGGGPDGVPFSQLLTECMGRGFAGHRLLAWGELADLSDASLSAAIAEFGGGLAALSIQDADFTRDVWDYVPTDTGQWPHAVMIGGYGNGVVSGVSWATRRTLTRSYLDHRLYAFFIPVWPELVSSGRFYTAGLDVSAIARDFRALTGKDLPGTNWQTVLNLTPVPVRPNEKWLSAVPTGWTKSALSQPFPARFSAAGGDVGVFPDLRRVLTPAPWTTREINVERVILDLENHAVYVPRGWSVVPNAGNYMVGRNGSEHAVILSASQRAVLLPSGFGWWSVV